ncbi:hypothetical protein SEA_STUBBY_149 [Mycobacterium phage Stubby]|uniref:Uncharacterized protein n=1 Tax=Mycobacterium phage Stubby TaxID=2510577 RepID=A0A411AZF3_9CAUD|nr:hypothetical protein SEA_STUBBY_149 [Mycobacterium phage Stubby]
MAHTDRDYLRWYREHHDCTYRPGRSWSPSELCPPQSCEICDNFSRQRFCVSLAAYSSWAKDRRREERTRARQALRECRDWDDLVICYRRPYFD